MVKEDEADDVKDEGVKEEIILKCPSCTGTFANNNNLRRHLKLHARKPNFKKVSRFLWSKKEK